MMTVVSCAIEDGVGLIVIDNPPVNASSQAVRAGLLEALLRCEADAEARAIVIAAEGRTFVAGADITEFGKPPLAPILPDVLNRIEACAKPVVVAWHGTALGAGCEIGLAAHARIITPDGQIGLPEVKLGLVPGAGGTQRLPRLVGPEKALDIILSGRMVRAGEALESGLVETIAQADLRNEAKALALRLADHPLRRTGDLTAAALSDEHYEKLAASHLRKMRGQDAPKEALRLLKLAAGAPLAEGLREERATFLKLMGGEQSAALRYAFFAERDVGKRPDLQIAAPRPVKQVGIVGAGTMGAGIAVAFLDAGFPVLIVEANEDARQRGAARVEGLYERAIASGRLTPEAKASRLAMAGFSSDRADLAGCDLVVEAVFEEMDVKIELLTALEGIVRPECILATNTSYLDINVMAEGLKYPERVVGLHFFSPANIMRLLEIVRAATTAPDVLATAIAIGKALKKTSVVAGVCDGFIGNRILGRYRAQCELMLEEGALPHEIDAALEAYGFAMGPFAVSDLAGLDISWARRKRLSASRPASERYVPLADRLCEMGRFGQKSGAGWYRYENGKRVVDPDVSAMIRAHAQEKALPQRVFSQAEILRRVLVTMANEGARIVEEGIAARPVDVDVVLLNGYGFPAYRGGPMFAADRMGWAEIVAGMEAISARDGAPFLVSELARRLAREDLTASSLNRI